MNEIAKSTDFLEPPSDDNTDAALSRRSFVTAVGTLVTLPAVAGGFLMPEWTDEAYAAEDGAGMSAAADAEDDPVAAKIIIAKKNEFGIVVCDITDNKKTPVANATVKLISCENQKEVSGKSDAQGKVLLDISSLSTLKKDINGVEAYSFYAQMDVSCEGYRNYRTGRINAIGGRGIMAPTRKLNNEIIYPQMVTFDDWDVLYTTNSFAVTVGNDVKHTFKVELVAKTDKPITIRIYSGIGRDSIANATVTPSNGIAKAEFTDYFLLTNHKSALSVDKSVTLVLMYDMNRLDMTLKMQAQAAPNAATAPGTAKLTLKPFDPNGLKPTITLPQWVPLLGGKVINVWTPELPLSLWFDPYGFVKFVARSGELGYKFKDSNGTIKEDAWKYHPRKSAEEQWDEVNTERNALMTKYGKAVRGKTGLKQTLSYTGKLGATAMVQIAAAGKWRNDEALWRMGISAQAVLAFNVSYAQQFMVGPVPCIFEFSMVNSLTVGVSMAVATTDLFEISRYSWDYGNAGISFTLVIAPSISFGVGIKGLLSASIQGQISFSFCVAIQAQPHDAGRDLPRPHITMGLVAQVNVVIQAFIFTKTFEMWNVGDPTFYDNWHNKVPGNTAQSLSAMATGTDDFGDGMELVKDEWLYDVSEFDLLDDGSEGAAMSAASDSELTYESSVLEMETLDGIPYQCTVIQQVVRESEPASSVVDDGSGRFVAGSSPTLEAMRMQAQEDTVPKPPKETQYEPRMPEKYSAFVEERTSKRFKGIGSQGGLIPANDVCVAKGVFSDPRIKAIRIGDQTHIFRISTAQVEGKSRTRIVGQVLRNSGKTVSDMKVFDFNPTMPKDIFSIFSNNQPNRSDMYDYDFDVVYTPMPKFSFSVQDLFSFITESRKAVGMLSFFVISGKRDKGNDTSFGQAACDQVFSIVRYLVFDDGSTRILGASCSTTSDAAYDAAGGGTEYKYHSFSCPQIAILGQNEEKGLAGWMLTYLDRAGKTPEDAVSAEAGKAKVGLGVCFLTSEGTIYAYKTPDLLSKVRPIKDSSTFEMTCIPRFSTSSDRSAWHMIMMRGRTEAVYYLLHTETLPDAFGATSSIKEVRAIEAPAGEGGEPMRLVEWPGHAGTFLASTGGKLQKVTIGNLNSATPKFNYEDCGLSEFNVNSFGIDPTGSVIFWPACRENDAGYSYDADGKATQRKWTEVHQVMGSRMRGGKFSQPFVYGEVNHDMHILQVLDYLNASSLTIVSVDMKMEQSADKKSVVKGKADLWFTSIPLAKCANVIGCEALSTFAYPGERALFHLTVRNDGNTFLSGFTAKLAEKGKSASTSTKLVFSKETLCESGYNPLDGSSLKDIEPDYALAPGKTSVYQVELEIPKDWKNEKRVTVSAADAVMASSSSVKAQDAMTAMADDEDVEEYIVGTGDLGEFDFDEESDYGTGQMPFDILDVWYEDTYDDDAEEDYEDTPITAIEGDNDGNGGNGGNGNANSPVTKPTPKSTAPTTGDPFNPLGLAAAAITAAGIGFAAYSKRRSDLEDQTGEPPTTGQ